MAGGWVRLQRAFSSVQRGADTLDSVRRADTDLVAVGQAGAERVQKSCQVAAGGGAGWGEGEGEREGPRLLGKFTNVGRL